MASISMAASINRRRVAKPLLWVNLALISSRYLLVLRQLPRSGVAGSVVRSIRRLRKARKCVHSRAPADGAGDLERLHPSYFALVMATGIVSIAAQIQGLRLIAVTLLAINIAAYVGLWVTMAARAMLYQCPLRFER